MLLVGQKLIQEANPHFKELTMISVKQKGNFDKSYSYLGKIKFLGNLQIKHLRDYAEKGVIALMSATPVDTGLTASSWYYKIIESDGQCKIEFCNSNIQNYVPIAIILQYGHATRNGGYVQGRDYINPAIKPIFDEIAKSAWKEVTKV